MWKRIYPKPSKDVLNALKELNKVAQTKLKGASRHSEVVQASDELDLNLYFFQYVYGVSTANLSKLLDTDESTIRKRVKRAREVPDNAVLIQDVLHFVDEIHTDDSDERYLAWRSKVQVSGASRFDLDIPKRGKHPYDYSSNPDMTFTVVSSIEQLFAQDEDKAFYITGDVYKYLIGEL